MAEVGGLPLVPAYGSGTLGELLPSIAAHLGFPGADVLGLPDANRYVVLMVDGLGWDVLNDYGADSGLATVATDVRMIEAGAPTTTVTSLASLGTGLSPGTHGLVGHTFRLDGRSFAPLKTTPDVDGLDVQPQMTWFERLGKARVWTSAVAPATFGASLFTKAVLRGARFVGQPDETDADGIARLTAAAAASDAQSVTYSYVRTLDQRGHLAGMGSPPWREALRFVGRLARRLRAELPRDAVLIVTGDHGMVEVPMTPRIVIEQTPPLARGVALVAGEARFRHLYASDGQVAEVARRWAGELGDLVWVRTREQALAEGWFGPVAPRMASRIGDVVVAARGATGVFTSTHSRELELHGMHGSLTPSEIRVPLLLV